MEDLTFTRLLYPYYDVVQSIYESFKLKENYDETLFWMCELYYSMYYNDSYFMLYFLYFSFNIHFDNDLKLYKNIQENQEKWNASFSNKKKEPTHSHFFKLFSKLYNANYNKDYNNILIEHTNSDNSQKLTIFKGKKPEFLKEFPIDLQKLIYSFHKQNKSNTWNYIEKYFIENSIDCEKAYNILLIELTKYINSVHNTNYEKKIEINGFCELFKNFGTDIPQHYYITISKLLMLHMFQKNESITKDNFIKSKYSNKSTYMSHYNCNDKYITSLGLKTYRLMGILRKYKLQIPYDRSLEESISLRRNYYYYWMNYISFCPLWKKRLLEYNASIKNDGSISFDKLDDEELFNDNYNYEPDEQSKEITNMVLL